MPSWNPSSGPGRGSDDPGSRWLRSSARAIALVWAGYWIWFGLNAAFDRGLGWTGVATQASVPGLFFLVLALIPWKWEGAGGLLLIVEAVVVAIGYPIVVGAGAPIRMILFVELTMALPPLVAGALFVQLWGKSRPRDGPPSPT